MAKTSLLLAAVLVAALATGVASATAAGTGVASKSMDARSRSFVSTFKICNLATGGALQVMRSAPNDLIGASQAVNEAKGICETVRDRLATTDTTHFGDQALDCEIAVDYFTRGLGRISNYIDDAKPSDITVAAEYFGRGHAVSVTCLRAINRRRVLYGLKRLS